jgi:aspartyl-tRNA synthetase
MVLFVCRKRYLDLLTSPTSRRTILARSAVIRTLRAHLEEQGFLEVETPILSGQVGKVMKVRSRLNPDSLWSVGSGKVKFLTM